MKKTIILFQILFSSILGYGQGSLGCIIADKPSGGVLTSGVTCTVDNASYFNVRQTTSGQVITVPNSASSTIGRIIWVANDSVSGCDAFTLVPGGVIGCNKSVALRWLGTKWVVTGESTIDTSSVDLTSLWSKSGNTLSGRGKFGSISGAYGWNYVLNNDTIGGVSNTGKFFIGNSSASFNAALTLHSADEKYLKFRDYADNLDALHIWIEDTTMDAYFQILNGAKIIFRDASTDILSLKPTTIEFATRPVYFSSGSNNGINLGTSASSYRLSLFVSDGSGGLSNEEAYLNVNNSNLNIRTGSSFSKIWQFDYLGNFGIQGSDYGGGNGVMYMANAAVNINANPTGGFLMQSKSGNPFFWTSSGDTIQLYKEAALTSPVTTLTSDAPGTPDYNYTGSVTNVTPYGLSSADELKSLLAIIKNLQDRINELEANLQNIGIQE